jgi:hypothetical protein
MCHVVKQTQTIDDEISDDGEEIIIVPETQITRVVNDEEFDEQMQNELKVVKQLWANMAEQEKPFTPFVSKSRKKKDKQKVRSACQPYNTRSKGAPSHRSF